MKEEQENENKVKMDEAKVEMDYDQFALFVGLLGACGRCADLIAAEADGADFAKRLLRACGSLGCSIIDSGAVSKDDCVNQAAKFIKAFGRPDSSRPSGVEARND